jgi:hypothetical protein
VDDATLATAQNLTWACRQAAWKKRDEAWGALRKQWAATAAAATAAAAAAAAAAASYRRIYDAAHAVALKGGDWHARYWAARKVADEVLAGRFARLFAPVRDELDAEFGELIRRMVAVGQAERAA